MRTAAGGGDGVVVVGAGLAGLSAALHLAGAGRPVTLLERDAIPGGRAGLLEQAGYLFDTGPAVLTMPDVLAGTFSAVGERLDDWLALERLDPAYRGHFPDGSTLDIRSSVDATAAEIEQICGSREAAGFRAFADRVGQLYRAEMPTFIDRNLDSVRSLIRPELTRLVALGGLRRVDGIVRSHFSDPRTRRMFSFQSLYAGLAPHEALGIYAVIAYMDTVGGVFFPRGGMHALPAALAAAATKHDVTIRYGTPVTRVELRGDRAVAVHTADGDRLPAGAVVLTADLPAAYRLLRPDSPAPRRIRRARAAPSCVLLLLGSRAGYPHLAHHNLHFGQAWREAFDDVVHAGRLMRDPSLLVSAPTLTDPALAPAGRHIYSVLVPAPNRTARIDWDATADRYREDILARLERTGYPNLRSSIDTAVTVTPADWERRGMHRGSPFALAHTFRQTGPFRPSTRAPGLTNVVFAGSSVQPGVGIPMVLISGRLAAQRLTGPA